MPDRKTDKIELPFLDRTEIVPGADGTLAVVGVFDGMSRRPVLARVGEDRQPFQTDEAVRMTAEETARVICEMYRRSWRHRNAAAVQTGVIGIDYNEGDEDVATSYRAVTVSGTRDAVRRFATGRPIEDWAAASAWAARNVWQLMASSSVLHFADDVAGFRFDEDGNLAANPDDTLEARRLGREPEAAAGPGGNR
jgi:hypothetical protein